MKFSLLPLSAALALVPLAYANEVELAAVVVTATRLDPNAAGTPTYIIEREQIEKSTAHNLSQLLATVPGISVRQLNGTIGTEGTVDLRGFGAAASTNTLILVDGRRLNDVDIGAANIGGVPLANIERIEVQPGGGSVLYGDGASGGSINIITRRPEKSGAEINIGAGSFNTLETTASGQLVSDAVTLGVFGQRQDGEGYRDNSEVRRDNIGADLRFKFSTQEIYLQGQNSKLESGLPGNRIVDPNISLDNLQHYPRSTSTPNDYANEDRYQIIAGWKAKLSDKLSLVIDGSRRNKQQQSFFDYGGGYSDFTDTTLNTVSLTPRLLFNYTTGAISNNLQAGIDWYQTDYRSLRGQASTTAPIHIIDIDAETTSPYVFQTSKLNTTSVSLGARRSSAKQSGRDTYNANAPGAFDSEAAPGTQKHTEEMYEAGISQELSSDLTAMISASRSVRLGTVDEVYENDPITYQKVFSPLLPQTAHNLEGSLVYGQASNRVTATLYQQKVNNEIHYNPNSGTNDNLGQTLRRGITLAGTTMLTESITLNASLTQQQALFRDGPNDGNTLPLVAERLGFVGINWQIDPQITMAVNDTFTGGKYLDNDQANLYGHKISGYHRIDARLGYAWQHLTAGVAVYNMAGGDDHFDEGTLSQYTPGRYSSYPLPGREYRFDIGLKF